MRLYAYVSMMCLCVYVSMYLCVYLSICLGDFLVKQPASELFDAVFCITCCCLYFSLAHNILCNAGLEAEYVPNNEQGNKRSILSIDWFNTIKPKLLVDKVSNKVNREKLVLEILLKEKIINYHEHIAPVLAVSYSLCMYIYLLIVLINVFSFRIFNSFKVKIIER